MSDKENKRKCCKCGKSPASDNIKLFRFPRPAVRNIWRCTLWAKYLFASEEEKYTSVAFQTKLWSEHKMLCQDHFANEDFQDSTKQRLLLTAVPCDTKRVSMTLPAFYDNAQPGPSQPRMLAAQSSQTTQKAQCGVLQMTSLQAESVERNPFENITNKDIEKSAKPTLSTSSFKTNLYDTKLKTEKEKNLYRKCLKYMRAVCNLRNKLKTLKKKAVLNVLTEDNSIKKLSKKLSPTFAFLLQAQIRNFNKSTGRRWTKEEKIVALRLFKRSPTCYRLLRRMFQLPSPGTLKALLNRMSFGVGVNKQVLTVMKNYIKNQPTSDNEFILMFDEMSLKKNLSYNSKEDIIEGYQDHGQQGRSPIIASYALVFMIAGIRKKVKQPVAHYFSSGFSTADRLAVIIKEVLQQCFDAGIKISAMVCDMDGVNRRALSILGATMEHPYISFQEQEIVTLFDAPHLLKCFRNLFIKYDVECITNITSDGKEGKGVAKWSHIKTFYELDNANQNFVFAPALTKDHINPNQKQKMRVKLAAQVLSHTVAAGLYAKISDGQLTPDAANTASLVANIDKLFDCLNSDSADLRRGKIHSTNLTVKTPHLELFSKMKKIFTSLKFIGCTRRPPSQEGWIWTMNATERLFKNLRNRHNIKSLATRRLQQDPLENLFGCIRGNCGANANPTTGQFVAALKTAIISGMAHVGSSGNCEADSNMIINNFSTLLSASQSTRREDDLESQELLEEHALSSSKSQNVEEDSAEIEACAYVCGFLLKKNPTVTCSVCREALVSANIEKAHIFVQCKEYSDFKQSLHYASRNLIDCAESSALITNNILNEYGHSSDLKKTIVQHIKTNVNFNFLKCPEHDKTNENFIANNIFYICIRRFCTLKNRSFADEASATALKRKMKIILHN